MFRRIKNPLVIPMIWLFSILVYLLTIYEISNLEKGLVEYLILKSETFLFFLTFILFIIFLFLSRKEIARLIRGSDLRLAIIVFLVALIVREIVPPKTTRLFFDEDIYLDMAKQIVTHFSSCLCDYGDRFSCFKCELMKWSVGHPFLISLAFFIFGIKEEVARHLTIFISSVSTIFVYFSSYLLFRNNRKAFFSSLILALLPVHILWSPTLAADVTFSFFVSFLFFFIALSSNTKNLKIHTISLLSLVLAVQAKTEGIILIFLYFLSHFILNKKYLLMFYSRKYLYSLSFSFLLLSAYFLHLFYAWKVDTWGSTGEKMSLEYFKQNFYPNAGFWFEIAKKNEKWVYEGKQLYHPVPFTILAILGACYLLVKNHRLFLFFTIWFLSLFLLYSSFYAGSVYYGVDVRYVLVQFIPFSFLSGFGAFFLSEMLSKIIDNRVALFLVLMLLLSVFIPYISKMSMSEENIEESYGARLYRKAAISFASEYPHDCYFISHVSSLYSWLGKRHLQIWYVYEPNFEEIVRDECVIFDEGYWCAIGVTESKSCLEFENRYNLELIKRTIDEKENKIYSFYRVYAK